MFLEDFVEPFENLPWNMFPTDEKHMQYGVTLAWDMFFFALEYPPLLDKIITLPATILEQIELNLLPLNENSNMYNVSLPLMLSSDASEQKAKLLDKLLSLGQKSFMSLDWNAPSLNKKNFLAGKTLAKQAITLAFHNKLNLLEKLLSLPTAILKGIYWNDVVDDAKQNRGTLLSYILRLFIHNKLNFKYITALFNPEVFATFNLQNDLHKERLAALLNMNLRECYIALARLSKDQIIELIEIFRVDTSFLFLAYLKFLNSIEPVKLDEGDLTDSLDADAMDYLEKHSAKSSMAYYTKAKDSLSDEALRIYYFKKVGAQSSYYARSQFELANLYLQQPKTNESLKENKENGSMVLSRSQYSVFQPPRLCDSSLSLDFDESQNSENSESPGDRQRRLTKAFRHACLWYINKASIIRDDKININQDYDFMVMVFKQVYSVDGVFKPTSLISPSLQRDFKDFLKELKDSEPKQRIMFIDQFLLRIKLGQTEMQLQELQKQNIKQAQQINALLGKRKRDDNDDSGPGSQAKKQYQSV